MSNEPAAIPSDITDRFSSKVAHAPEPVIAAEQTALIVVDLVNDYLLPDGAMPVDRPEAMLERVHALVAAARNAGVTVVWVRPGHFEQADGLFRKRIPHAFDGTVGGELHSSIEPRSGEYVLTKRRYSAFFQTDLDMYLREHGIRRTVVCGVALNICVRSTIHDAFFNSYDVWLAEDASLATGPREAASTVYDITTHFGLVKNVAEISTAWAR